MPKNNFLHIEKNMSTDTRFIVDQFRLTNRISSLGVMQTTNPLLPETYSRVQVPFLKQNRRENFTVAYGDSNKTYTFPGCWRVRT